VPVELCVGTRTTGVVGAVAWNVGALGVITGVLVTGRTTGVVAAGGLAAGGLAATETLAAG
jgi:hypothetical protein